MFGCSVEVRASKYLINICLVNWSSLFLLGLPTGGEVCSYDWASDNNNIIINLVSLAQTRITVVLERESIVFMLLHSFSFQERLEQSVFFLCTTSTFFVTWASWTFSCKMKIILAGFHGGQFQGAQELCNNLCYTAGVHTCWISCCFIDAQSLLWIQPVVQLVGGGEGGVPFKLKRVSWGSWDQHIHKLCGTGAVVWKRIVQESMKSRLDLTLCLSASFYICALSELQSSIPCMFQIFPPHWLIQILLHEVSSMIATTKCKKWSKICLVHFSYIILGQEFIQFFVFCFKSSCSK